MRNDPRWITAKFASTCSCNAQIKKGSRIYYYPIGRKALCEKCGDQAEREFQAAVADEQFMNS